MLCLYPVNQDLIRDGTTFTFKRRCGYCETCRLYLRSVWAARIQLEANCHEWNSFVTLTYDDEHCPVDGSLDKRELQLFFKRLRKALTGLSIRYFACGEYGDITKRCHYHAVIFGLAATPENEMIVHNAWGKGFVSVRELNRARSVYTAKYTTKKIRGGVVPEGCLPEFALMSRRPGIGMRYVEEIVNEMARVGALLPQKDSKDGNPVFAMWKGYVNVNGSFFPAGRYLRDKVKSLLSSRFGQDSSELRQALNLTIDWFKQCRNGEDLEVKRLREAHARKARRMLKSGGDI